MAAEVNYENGKPAYAGGTVIKCFKDNGNGLLFRIVNDEEKKWAFYNDTLNYHMYVKVIFGKDSHIEPLGNTKFEHDHETGECRCEIAIAPTTTEMFIKGEPNGYKISFEAKPIAK